MSISVRQNTCDFSKCQFDNIPLLKTLKVFLLLLWITTKILTCLWPRKTLTGGETTAGLPWNLICALPLPPHQCAPQLLPTSGPSKSSLYHTQPTTTYTAAPGSNINLSGKPCYPPLISFSILILVCNYTFICVINIWLLCFPKTP